MKIVPRGRWAHILAISHLCRRRQNDFGPLSTRNPNPIKNRLLDVSECVGVCVCVSTRVAVCVWSVNE